MAAHNYQSGYASPLKKVSTQTLIKELMLRNGVKFTKEKDIYTITANKREVEI